MEDLKEMGLVKLNKNETKLIEGGVIFARFKEIFEVFHWAYTEFKKGVHDGYNNR